PINKIPMLTPSWQVHIWKIERLLSPSHGRLSKHCDAQYMKGGCVMNIKEKGTTLLLSGVIAASVAVGAVGGTMLSALGTNAQTPSTPAATPATGGNAGGSTGATSGTFKSNEDPAHEANESPQREAQENAGQRPTVP